MFKIDNKELAKSMFMAGLEQSGIYEAKHTAVVGGWTDYPIEDFGDEPYVEAPVRQCEIIDYDCDKYVTVKVYDDRGNVTTTSIKRGYVYKQPGRCGEDGIHAYSHDTLEDIFG